MYYIRDGLAFSHYNSQRLAKPKAGLQHPNLGRGEVRQACLQTRLNAGYQVVIDAFNVLAHLNPLEELLLFTKPGLPVTTPDGI
jgi:hypothetical protein